MHEVVEVTKYLFPGLRRGRRDKMHCTQSEHPYSYMYVECS